MQNIRDYYVALAGPPRVRVWTVLQVMRQGRNTWGQPGTPARTYKHITKLNWLGNSSLTGKLYLHCCVALHCTLPARWTLHWTGLLTNWNSLSQPSDLTTAMHSRARCEMLAQRTQSHKVHTKGIVRFKFSQLLLLLFLGLTADCWLARPAFIPGRRRRCAPGSVDRRTAAGRRDGGERGSDRVTTNDRLNSEGNTG